jgi:hypothetical protein
MPPRIIEEKVKNQKKELPTTPHCDGLKCNSFIKGTETKPIIILSTWLIIPLRTRNNKIIQEYFGVLVM